MTRSGETASARALRKDQIGAAIAEERGTDNDVSRAGREHLAARRSIVRIPPPTWQGRCPADLAH